ncbi:uncharacterized protein LOC113336633 [Papaver somniferum]|uniref:uncharacterized protein LOC113336633 n=1 Tax=Papaver somniferum TaxID=3469 RepID=UPI000E6FED05|nr:uncharacterized protein LOC113336633 [Papaver somniferum]
MKTNIISWNVNGLLDITKRDSLQVLLRMWKPDIICLQETHVKGWKRHQVKQLWGANNFNYVALDSIGRSGGIIIIWNTNTINVIDFLLGAFSISVRCNYINDDFVWMLTSVYGPVHDFEKDQFWDELRDMRTIWDDPWVLSGDFNCTRFANERSEPQVITRSMRRFASLVRNHQLMDLPLVGSHFTWSRNTSWSKIDRFEKIWLQDDSLRGLMETWWHSFSFTGTPGFILAKKMQALKEKLKVWNRDVFGKIDRLVQANLISIQGIFAQLALDPNNAQLLDDQIIAAADLKRLAKMHSDFWKQRTNINWVEEHENNTHFSINMLPLVKETRVFPNSRSMGL